MSKQKAIPVSGSSVVDLTVDTNSEQEEGTHAEPVAHVDEAHGKQLPRPAAAHSQPRAPVLQGLHPPAGAAAGTVVAALGMVHSVEDVLPELEQLAATGNQKALRDLYFAAIRVQEAVRKVQATHEMHFWLSLHCHCNSRVHWALGDTTCHGDRSRRGYKHKLHIEKLLCTFCNTSWKLESLDSRAARSSGQWHPRIHKHCINEQCSRGQGKETFKTATCSDISKKNGPVLLR